MTSGLRHYMERFAHLRTDKSMQRWTENTKFRAPHKPLLLLTVLSQIEGGSLKTNRIYPSPELALDFRQQWARVLEPSPSASFVLPFFHLRSEGFWHLVAVPGKQDQLHTARTLSGASQLHELVDYATLDSELFALAQSATDRAALVAVLVETYFVGDAQSAIREQVYISAQAAIYSEQLLNHITTLGTNLQPNVRSQGFRRAVIRAYERSCAFCGIRLITPDWRVVVDAAHIIPWSHSQNDDPCNGIALCKLCHWTFDAGFLCISDDFCLHGSPQLRVTPNLPEQVIRLTNRRIIGPRDESLWPSQSSLAWHRDNKFMRSA